MILQTCSNNQSSLALAQQLEKEFHRSSSFKMEECLKKCGICKKSPFVVVDGEVLSADEPEQLLQTLRARLNRD